MAGPLDLAAAVRAVALVLDGGQVRVLGLEGRGTYPHESDSAAVTVSVHLDGARDVDRAADLLSLGEGAVRCDDSLYWRAGHRQPGDRESGEARTVVLPMAPAARTGRRRSSGCGGRSTSRSPRRSCQPSAAR
jgi:hypothetical protein